MAFLKSILIMFFCFFQSQLMPNDLIRTNKYIASINKQRMTLKSKLNKKFIWHPITLPSEPSAYYKPDFYNPNEFKDIYVTYKMIQDKVERPIEYKKVDTSKSTELSFITHVDSGLSFTNFKISLELEAKFL